MIVYISGPMTGYRDFNRDAFFAAEKHLRDKGFTVVNPAALDAADGSDVVIQPHAYYMRRDLKALLNCDLIYLLPGWRYSKGAITEKTVADVCGILRLEDPDVDTWRTFEGEPEDEVHAKVREDDRAAEDPFAESPSGEGVPEAGDEDLSDHPRFGPAFGGRLVLPCSPEFDVTTRNLDCYLVTIPDGEAHLDEVSAVRPDDAFPNVGYVRRFKRLLGVEG